MYEVIMAYVPEIAFKSDNIRECVQYIKDNELAEYHDHLDYCQHCAENYERPADYYPTYFVDYENKTYDITDINVLERLLNERGV